MKILAIVLVIAVPHFANAADIYVHGYSNSNGTTVRPYERTAPNDTKADNYSTRGNYNPYTGKEGTKAPDSQNHNGFSGAQY